MYCVFPKIYWLVQHNVMLANMPNDFHETLNLALKIKQLSIPFASKFMHAKRWLKVSRVFPKKIVQQMFGVKTPSMTSLVSKQWSTSELTAGMEHLFTDMRNELPDEVAHLEAHHAADHQSRTSRLNFLGSACGLQKPCDFVGHHVASILWRFCDFFLYGTAIIMVCQASHVYACWRRFRRH